MCTEFSQVELLQVVDFIQGKIAICLEGGVIIVDLFRVISKPLCNYGVLDVICLFNSYPMLRLSYAQDRIEQLWTFLGDDRGVPVHPMNSVLNEVGDEVGTHEVICVADNYQNVLGGFYLKDVESMVYDMLGKS